MTSVTDTLEFKQVSVNDTLTEIPAGLYQLTASSCDNSIQYSQSIEIVADQMRFFIYTGGARIGDEDNPNFYNPLNPRYYYGYMYDTNYTYDPIYVVHGFQFGRGIDIGNENDLVGDFALDYTAGQDFLVTKPIAIGYEAGFGY